MMAPRLLPTFVLLSAGAAAIQEVEVARSAGRDLAREEVAVLSFRILGGGAPMPGRLTFWERGSDATPDLFPQADAAPDDLALRKNVVYTLRGEGAITVPPGEYRVFASRGIEWSVDSKELSLAAGASASWDAQLVHEVDTPGWISGDFHLHTLTHSGHGDSNMPERIISLVGEGVDFAVATDHNHNTDYGPTVAHLDAGAHLAHVVGNEVSTPIGHFNAFPLSADRDPVDATLRDANELFRLLRAEPNTFGIEPIVQLNHPRWAGIDYFALTGLDPVTGASSDPAYSEDFDSLEVFNENTGWGYCDPAEVDVSTGDNLHSVLKDWFHLLNRGKRYAAVGNSDSHTVHYAFAGYPRNYVPCSSLENAAVEVARAVREKALFTTLGPVIDFSIGEHPMGSEASAPKGRVTLSIRVRAASWIDCDRVKIVVNGDVAETLPVPAVRSAERLRVDHPLELDGDAWIALLVEGDDALRDVVPGGRRAVLPLAITNPIWVDADGDGTWTPPYERIRVALRSQRTYQERGSELFASQSTSGREMLLWAAAADGSELLPTLVRAGLSDAERGPRLAAVCAAEAARLSEALPWLRDVWAREHDEYFAVRALRALHAAGEDALAERFFELRERHGAGVLQRHAGELAPILPGRFVEEWMVLGYFESAEPGAALAVDLGPESASATEARYAGKGANEIGWAPLRTTSKGYLDLLDLQPDRKNVQESLVYAETWLHSEAASSVPCAWGTGDGSRVYLNGELVYEDPSRRSANPLEHMQDLELRAGWNRVLFKVENGTGDFGLYFRVLDDTIRAAARPE